MLSPLNVLKTILKIVINFPNIGCIFFLFFFYKLQWYILKGTMYMGTICNKRDWRATGRLSLFKHKGKLEFIVILAAMWAAELPDLLTQDKEHLLKEKAKPRTLLKTVVMDQSEHTDKEGGSMHSLESLLKMTWGRPLREDCWTTQRRAEASAWRGQQGLCILVRTCITLPAWSLAIAARAVKDVDTAASIFTFIQSCGDESSKC